jgi:hypothetical protein
MNKTMIEVCFSPHRIEIKTIDYDQSVDLNSWIYGGGSEHWLYCANMVDAHAALKAKIEKQMANLKKASKDFGLNASI